MTEVIEPIVVKEESSAATTQQFILDRSITNFNPVNARPLVIVGSGATGSKALMDLAKSGYPLNMIHVYDPKMVQSHNIANQAFFQGQALYIDDEPVNPKVEAINDLTMQAIGSETGMHIYARLATTEDMQLHALSNPIVCVLTDTMDSRVEMYKGLIGNNTVVLETAVGRSVIKVQQIQELNAPMKAFKYIASLPPDDEVPVSECGTVVGIGVNSTLVGAFLVSWILNICEGREIPLKMEFDLFNFACYTTPDPAYVEMEEQVDIRDEEIFEDDHWEEQYMIEDIDD